MSKTIRAAIARTNKKHPGAVTEFWQEDQREEWGGDYWLSLRGYHLDDCHSIHERTVKEVLEALQRIEPCTCDECKEA